MTRQARALRQRLIEQGLIAPHDTRPLPLIACQSYLNAGIDHVLVGMRTPQYVDSLRSIFWEAHLLGRALVVSGQVQEAEELVKNALDEPQVLGDNLRTALHFLAEL